jgi:2-O-(6-phospho-alpha-D-mannosyl)-D-glycerate hydrolase
MKAEKKSSVTFHLIPNTHWDREWLYDFQETRMLLVEFMDRLLKILADHPEYRTYLLDSQTVPIDDYLEIRPEKREEIVQRVEEKRLFIGPWYTLPEEHLVNGESLVRNLLIGGRRADQYGGSMKIGYSPFSYGQASQMPQIYRGFGIETILFYHGIQPSETPAEFILEGPDGSQLFASRLGSNARYNFFFSVYRPAVFGKESLERDYAWEEKGLPFHLCGQRHFQEHHILLDPVKELDTDRLAELMERLKQVEQQHTTTDQVGCMQGMDSTQPDVCELETAREVAKILEDDTILHSSLPEWLDAVRAAVREEDLVILKGERRTPRQLGTRVHLYSDVTSARVKIKRKNARAEQDLQRKAEPLAAVAHLLGAEYPKAYLDLAWNYLLKSQPHDTIAGTGIDQIEHDVHHRLDQCRSIANGVKRRALQAIQTNIDNADVKDDEVVLTIFNPAPYRRDEVVTAVVDLPRSAGFELGRYCIRYADTGKPVEYQEAGRWEHPAIVRHLGDATMEMPSLRVRLRLALDDLPGLGYRTLLIAPAAEFSWPDTSLISGASAMENAFLKVVINPNGTLDVTDKTTGHTFAGLHYFADDGEAGHAWRHVPPSHDRVVTTLNSSPKIERIESGPCLARFAVTHTMVVPKKLDEGQGDYIRRLDADGDDAGRSDETGELVIRSEFTLDAHARGVAVRTTFVNTCEDHRLRVMFPTELAASHSSAEEPFDVVQRPIDRGPDSPWRGTWNPTHPFQRFVDLSDGNVGLALISDGMREYEVTDDASRTVGLTLVRAFELALTTVAWRWERHPEMKGSQALGEHQWEYVIYPHAGDWDAGNVARQADQFNVPLEPVQAGPHPGELPKTLGFLELGPAELTLSCMKQSEQGDSLVVRLYNPTSREIAGSLTLFRKPRNVRYLALNEEPTDDTGPKVNGNTVDLKIAPSKIVTLELSFH